MASDPPFESSINQYIQERIQSKTSQLIGLAAGSGLGVLLGCNVYFFPSMLMDGLAQLTELALDCALSKDGTRAEICIGRNRKSIRRRKNCMCCDCTRNVLFGVAPGMIGGVIDMSTFLANLGNNVGNFTDPLFHEFYPRDFGLVVVWSNLLQILVNYPITFCLHHRAVNSYRFLLACVSGMAIRSIYQLQCVITHQFAWMSLLITQVLGYYAFSLVLYADHPFLNKKIIPTGDTSPQHYDEPDWDMPPGSEARLPPMPPISDDTKQAWWNMPFLSTFEPRPPAPKPSAPPYVAPDRSRVSSALSPQGPKPPPQPLGATNAEESQSPVRDPGAEQTESSLHPAPLRTPAVDQHEPPLDADPMGRKETAAPPSTEGSPPPPAQS